MMGSSRVGPCPVCGAEHEVDVACVRRGRGPTDGPALEVLPPLTGEDPLDPPTVRLVRQLKVQTIDHLMADATAFSERLPEALQSVADAVAEGDLARADARLDEALGAILAGPGHRKRSGRSGAVALALWIWVGLLILLVVLSLFS